jgi:hypothetical protein
MKTIFLTFVILSLGLTHLAFAQTNEEAIRKLEELERSDTLQTLKDTTRVKIGKKEVSIIEVEDQTEIRVKTIPESNVSSDMKTRMGKVRKFRGHWSGFEFGFNNYLNTDYSTSLDASMEYMELRASKSFNVNINFLQYNLRIAGDNFGLVTGMGLEFNDYKFLNENTIERNGGAIQSVDLTALNLQKSKLSTTYLTVPLLVEFQTPHISRNKRVYFSTGVIGGVRLASHIKYVHFENGKKRKEKLKDDFYLSPFRYGGTFRVGYRQLNLFANYYFTPLFEKNKGPELYPFSVGLSLVGF